MKTYKLFIAAVGATVLLGALTSAASARSIAGNTTRLSVSFSSIRFEGLFGTADCVVSLSGSFHTRTITKSPGTLIGFINDARMGACANGTVTVLRETLPWHARYRSFSGTLPNITLISADIIGMAFRARVFENCLFRSEASEPARAEFSVSSGTITGDTAAGSIRSGAECFSAAGRFTSSVGRVTGEAGTITVRLI